MSCRSFCSATARPERLAAALLPLLADTPERRRQIEAFARLDDIMEIGRRCPERPRRRRGSGAMQGTLCPMRRAKQWHRSA